MATTRTGVERFQMGLRLWALPMLLIASGPPIFRNQFRTSLASIQGSVDFWVAYQGLIYAAAGAMSALLLLSGGVRGLPRRHLMLAALTAGVLLFCLASSLWSPSAMATFVMAALLVTAIFVTVQFSVSASRSTLDPMALWSLLRVFSLAMAAMILAAYFAHIRGVATYNVYEGFRLRGGTVGVTGTVGMTIFTISLYRLAMVRPGHPIEAALTAAGLGLIYITHTRAAYLVSVGVATLIWLLWVIRPEVRRKSGAVKLAATLMIVPGIVLILLVAGRGVESLFLRNSGESFSNLSHRTTIWGWILDASFRQPMGYGFSTGFRYAFQNMNYIDKYAYREQGLVIGRIGESHNSYLEMLVGSGWLAFLMFIAALTIVTVRCVRSTFRTPHRAATRQPLEIGMVLLISMLLDAFTTSSYIRPTHQPLGYLLFTIGAMLALEARQFSQGATASGPAAGSTGETELLAQQVPGEARVQH